MKYAKRTAEKSLLAKKGRKRQSVFHLKAMIFVRHAGAYGAGHVGWGWQWSPDEPTYRKRWVVGSVEDLAGKLKADPAKMNYWSVITRDPVAAAKRYGYDDYKIVDVPSADPDAALRVQAWVEARAYTVIGRNCMDDVYDILRAYGATLPPPLWHWLPNHWFRHIKGHKQHIHYFIYKPKPNPSWTAHPPRRLFWHNPGVMLDRLYEVVPNIHAPKWREPGTGMWADFVVQTAKGAAKDLKHTGMRAGSLVEMLGTLFTRFTGRR